MIEIILNLIKSLIFNFLLNLFMQEHDFKCFRGWELILLGELNKWVPMSPGRIKEIRTTLDEIYVTLSGGAFERVTFSHSANGTVVHTDCVLSASGSANLSVLKELCISWDKQDNHSFYNAMLNFDAPCHSVKIRNFITSHRYHCSRPSTIYILDIEFSFLNVFSMLENSFEGSSLVNCILSCLIARAELIRTRHMLSFIPQFTRFCWVIFVKFPWSVVIMRQSSVKIARAGWGSFRFIDELRTQNAVT